MRTDARPSGDDPWTVLGLTSDATWDDIRARYVELIKRHPPDRDPEGFERIRDAYKAASDPRWRARQRILGPEPLADLDELATALRSRGRRPVGAQRWLRFLAEERKQ